MAVDNRSAMKAGGVASRPVSPPYSAPPDLRIQVSWDRAPPHGGRQYWRMDEEWNRTNWGYFELFNQ